MKKKRILKITRFWFSGLAILVLGISKFWFSNFSLHHRELQFTVIIRKSKLNRSFKNIAPHICRHTYCTNMAKSGMNPKTLRYLMGHSDIGVTMNVYTHLGFDDAKDEMVRMEELEQARKEVQKGAGERPITYKAFKVV